MVVRIFPIVHYKHGDMVMAIHPKSKYLTHGALYFVQWMSKGDKYIVVRDNSGKIRPYSEYNFIDYRIPK